MMQMLRSLARSVAAAAYALSGAAGFFVAALTWSWGYHAFELAVRIGANSAVSHRTVSAVLAVVWLCFPRFRAELYEWRHVGWLWILAGAMLILSLVTTGFWSDLSWLAGKVTFGWITTIARPDWSPRAESIIEATAMTVMVSSIWVAHRLFTGSDRGLLMTLGTAWSVAFASMVYPEFMRIVGLVIVGFFISLTWGSPHGQNAQNVLRSILSLFRRRPQSTPTTIGVPEAGHEVDKL